MDELRSVVDQEALLPSWCDFWLDTLPHISKQTLFTISCTSKSFNELIWTVISSSDQGLKLSNSSICTPEETHQKISNYLARTPNLKTLKLANFPDYSLVPLLARLTGLKCLSYPITQTLSFFFPFEGTSHLTNLTDIDCMLFQSDPSTHLGFHQFPHLKVLCLHRTRMELPLIDCHLHELPSLETLSLLETRIDHLPTTLTNLKHLHLSKITNELEFHHLTNLRKLFIQGYSDIDLESPDLQALTSLEDLELSLVQISSRTLPAFGNILSFRATKCDWDSSARLWRIPKTRNLEVVDCTSDTYGPFYSLRTMTGLTNLRIRSPAGGLLGYISDTKQLSGLTSLTSLSMRGFGVDGDPISIDDQVLSLTNLKVLHAPIRGEGLGLVRFHLTNLKELETSL